MKLYRSKLKSKWDDKKYIKYFNKLKTSSVDVLDVLKGLYFALIERKGEKEVLFDYINAIFYQPELAFSDDVLTQPKCKDLTLELCSKPLADISHHEKTLRMVKTDLETNVLSKASLNALEMEDVTKDSIIILERDKSIASKLETIKLRLEASILSQNINLVECVDLVNIILSIYNHSLIDIKVEDMVVRVCCYDDKMFIGQKNIPISLISEKMLSDTLSSDELLQMLSFLNEEIPNVNCTNFKTLITKVLYQKLS